MDKNITIFLLKQSNTWGETWNCKGNGHIIWNDYKMTEAWTILRENPMFKFTKTLKFGMRDPEVKELQKRLLVWPQSGWFGPLTFLAVKKYQAKHNLTVDGIVGKNTISVLNGS